MPDLELCRTRGTNPMTLPIGKARKIRKPDGTPKVRRNFWLANGELLREMAGGWNFSWFLDELIAREYRRREKSTQSKNDSALTEGNQVVL